MSCLCKSEGKTPSAMNAAISEPKPGQLCARCFTFWAIVALLALGILYHYHTSTGAVRIG